MKWTDRTPESNGEWRRFSEGTGWEEDYVKRGEREVERETKYRFTR